MAHWAAKYGVYVLSTANYVGGVAYSSLMEDFPCLYTDDTLYDHKSGFQRFDGRHPVTNIPLMVKEYDRYETIVTQNGVLSMGDGIAAPYGDPITAVSLEATTSSAGIMADINAHADHLIYGVWNVVDEDDDLPPALVDSYRLSEMPAQMRTDVRNFVVAKGADPTKTDNWFTNHPAATPQDVKDKFDSFVTP